MADTAEDQDSQDTSQTTGDVAAGGGGADESSGCHKAWLAAKNSRWRYFFYVKDAQPEPYFTFSTAKKDPKPIPARLMYEFACACKYIRLVGLSFFSAHTHTHTHTHKHTHTHTHTHTTHSQ